MKQIVITKYGDTDVLKIKEKKIQNLLRERFS